MIGRVREFAWSLLWTRPTTPCEVDVRARGGVHVVARLLADPAPRVDERSRWQALGGAITAICAASQGAAVTGGILVFGSLPDSQSGALLLGVDAEGKAPRPVAIIFRRDGRAVAGWADLAAPRPGIVRLGDEGGRPTDRARPLTDALLALANELQAGRRATGGIRRDRPPEAA